jgi:hypothetical protein
MTRREKLFSIANKLKENKIGVILIQIDEAHTDKWPIGRDYQPSIQSDFNDRLNRTNNFIQQYNPPLDSLTIIVDDWNNSYGDRFRAWPDKYYLIDNNFNVIAKSEYGTDENNDGVITLDCVVLVERLIENLI